MYGLEKTTIRSMQTVFERFPAVEKVIIYGSRARSDYRSGSDIDLTLLGSADLNNAVLTALDDELDQLLLPLTIDLSLFSQIRDEALRERIRREGIPFYVRGETIVTIAMQEEP